MRSLFIPLFSLLILKSHGQIITTVAGQAPPTYLPFSGDGGPAVNAHLGGMYHGSVGFDAAGNMYLTIAENRIVKVDAAGILTTIAGNGTLGYSGDGGLAINALVYHPGAIIVDNAGNIIFGDQNDEVLRQIDAAGIITTISAPNASACSGEGVPLSQAVFTEIYGLSKDNAGNIYVSDQACNTVRKISTSRIVTTVAGNGTAGFSGDGGPAIAAQLNYPGQVGVDNAGNLYIPDARNHRIRKINLSGIITTIGGNGVVNSSGDGGPAASAEFAFPISICVDNTGNIYVAENIAYVVRKIDAAGIVTDYAGNYTYGYSGDGGPANLAQVTEIENIDQDAAGNLYIVDYYNEAIRKITNCLTATFSLQPAPVLLCNSGNATFISSMSNANSLQWQINTGASWVNLTDNGQYSGCSSNTLLVTGTDPTMNNDQFRCVATNSCGNAYSLPATLTVQMPSTPSLTISTSSPTICAGVNATFQAVPTLGGLAPIYQWHLNGAAVGTNSNTYANAGLNSGDVVNCVLTSNSTCATTPSAVSNSLTMTVDPTVTPAISVAGPGGAICAGSPAGFTANVTNEGLTPAYQWQVNGVNAGTNSTTYTNSGLNNGDMVTCMLTSNAMCATTSMSASNSVTVTVTPLVTPAISVTGPGGALCAGSPANFTASPTNGGATPAFQWLVNGVGAGSNSPTYTNSGLNNGDVVTCALASDADCTTSPTAMSNSVTMTVNTLVTPALSISTPAPFVCAGSAAGFSASPINGGAAPSYQWLVNGLPTGSTGATYANGSLNDGDAISCVMTSDATCVATPAVVSNTIVEQVRPQVNAAVTVAASATAICSGTQVTFTATPINGGTSAEYQWQVDGKDVGPDKQEFSINDLADGDLVSCILTSSLSCSAPVASQNPVEMTVNANPTVVLMRDTIIGLGQSLVLEAGVTGPVTSYQWTPATGLNNANAAAPEATPENTTTYQLTVTTDANCTASGKLTIGVFKTLKMPAAFTPNGDGKNDLFRIPPSLSVKINAFAVYDRWGARVFYTNNSTAGWDGTLGGQPQPVGTYVWTIEYDDLLTGKPAQAKGTVILIK